MSWLEDLLGYKDVRDALGALVPRRKQLRFLDGGVVDNPTLGTTDISFGAAADHGSQVTADGIHTILGLGPYTTAALRRAAVLTSVHVGKVARQTDTVPASLWYVESVSGGVGTWRQFTTTSDAGASDPTTIITSVPLTAWWRGDTVVQSGSLVSQWTDKKTSGTNHLLQATGSLQPIYTASDATLNNQPTLTGDGVDDIMNCAGITIGAAYWMCWVVKQVGWSSQARIVSTGGGIGRNQIRQVGGSPQLYLDENPNSNGPNGGAPIGAWKRISQAQSNATTDFLKVGSVVVTGTALGRTTSGGSLTIFNQGSTGAPSNVALAEGIVTLGIPTVPEQTAIDAYLSARYLASLLT
jgi:hypothetical protein